MPTSFTSVSDGQQSAATQLNQFAAPVNNLESGLAFWAGTTTGSGTAYAATLTPAPGANVDGTRASAKFHTASTGAATFALNGNAAMPIKRQGAAIGSGHIAIGSVLELVLFESAWHIVGDGVGAAGVSALDDLSDVVITSPGTGQVVGHDGTNFRNVYLAATDITTGNFAAGRLASGTATSGLVPISNGTTAAWGAPAPAAHNHAASEVTSGNFAAGRLASGTATSGLVPVSNGTTAAWGAPAPAAHNHAASEVTSGTLDTARLATGTATSGFVPISGGAGTAAWGAPSASDATKLPLAGGTMTGAITLSGNFTGASGSVTFANNASGPTVNVGATAGGGGLQILASNTLNMAFNETYGIVFYLAQTFASGFYQVVRTANGMVLGSVAGTANRTQVPSTSVPNATFVTICSLSGITQGQLTAVVTGMGSIIMDWDGTTLTKLAGATTLVVAASAGGTEVAFRASGGNLQASNGTGAGKNVSCPLVVLH